MIKYLLGAILALAVIGGAFKYENNEDSWHLIVNKKEALDSVREKTALIPAIDENRFLNSFSHIFSGGYAAGYFSYKWAEVLAADAYEFVKDNGGIKSKSAADFRKFILEVGGSLDFMEQYIKFRGGKPKMEGLLKSSGISI